MKTADGLLDTAAKAMEGSPIRSTANAQVFALEWPTSQALVLYNPGSSHSGSWGDHYVVPITIGGRQGFILDRVLAETLPL